MRFTFDGKDYLIQFKYEQNKELFEKSVAIHKLPEISLNAPNVTSCTFFQGAVGSPVKEMENYTVCGKAVRAANEQHNKEKGRKVALTRLLQGLNKNKAFRTAAWTAYFNRKSH